MFVLIAFAIMILAGVALTYSVESAYYNSFKTRLESGFENWKLKAEPTREELLAYFRNLKTDAYFTFGITEYKTFTIVDGRSNEVIFSNDKLFETDRNKLLNELLMSENYISALAGGKGDADTFLKIEGKVYFDYALKKGDFVFYFRYDREDWIKTVQEFRRVIEFSLFVAVFLSVVMGYFLSKTITNPIGDLMRKARRIAAGDFGDVLEVRSEDEIGKLTGTFNYMAKELKDKLNEISREKNKIETVFKYMSDGVIAFNSMGEIIHINLTAKRLLSLEGEGMSFDEFSQNYGLGILLEDFEKGESVVGRAVDIKVGDSFIKTYLGFFTDEEQVTEGIICVLHDVTEEKRLEELQREFVANVSHELKTPLASIKSYTETMMEYELDRETVENFLKIINSESDRMAFIVRDLLQLSRIDSNRVNWQFAPLPLSKVVEDCIEKMRIEAKGKAISIEADLDQDLPNIRADRHRLEQVMINILSNAIKYTQEGGKVLLQTGKLAESLFIRVRDTGIGIPEESIGRIFERFYRVDKARAREMGGTGLGLSIAKEIVEAHGGTISAASTLGEGTEILIILPFQSVTEC